MSRSGEKLKVETQSREGSALGYAEGWRGPVLLGNIIPDFPLCNKSFDLSYSGNDL